MHAISSYRGNRSTKPQTHNARPLQTGPITIHFAAKLSAQCNKIFYLYIPSKKFRQNSSTTFWVIMVTNTRRQKYSVKPLQFYCQSLSISYLIRETQCFMEYYFAVIILFAYFGWTDPNTMWKVVWLPSNMILVVYMLAQQHSECGVVLFWK